MDHKELGTNSSVNTGVSDGSTKFAHNSPTIQVQSSRSKSYDVGSNALGKVEATAAARPCAIIGPDRVLLPNPDDTMYLKKMPGETWPPPEHVYRRPLDHPSKISDYQPTRNISPRQTFQENMQRIMVPPTFSSMKSSEVSNLKNTKLAMPQEAKYCDVPYNVNSVNSEHKSIRNSDIPMSNVTPSYPRNMPPPYGWPGNVNVRPLRPYGAPEFYQYQEYPSCAGPRPMTMIRPHRPLHEESAQVYSERLYQDANIRFKPYSTGKEKHQQPRYDYVSNYPSTFHPPAPLPPHKYDLQKSIHGHPYPVCPPVPYKYLDRRIHEPFVDGYHRSHGQQTNFNAFHNQIVPPPYGPTPGNCMQNKTYSDAPSKPMNVNKIQFENNNKVYLNLESRNKNYSVPENLYYNDMNHSQAMRSEILLPTHSMLNMHPMPQHSIYRKDNTPLKPYDYNPNFRIFDQSLNNSLQRLPMQFSPNTVAISPSDSNTSNDTIHTIGTTQEDCGYVSQSSTASIRSFDSGNIHMPQYDIYRRHVYNNYDMVRNTFHPIGPVQIPKNKTSSSNKKNLDVRQFLQMWNEGDEEVSEANKEAAAQNHTKKISSQSEIINNQEQLYVLGLVNVPNEELGKYDHIQKISKLPENIKGYNSIEILNQYEELLETPHVSNNYNRSREYNILSKSQIDKDITTKMPRPISPLDVEAKISQSVIHKEVGCNFEIKPCSPEMLNVEVAAPVQNILGERIIEKVANPILTKSPNLNRGENKKSQNAVNDAVNTASCKMISDQYSSNSSPSRTKTSNYSMQDLERNAGLCLASLPQLDNDIELNFPEINQQFIKANQIESNAASTLHNSAPHLGLEQTHCMSHETRNDSMQQNLSQFSSGVDKESSKLSKYRKGRKSELTISHDIMKQDIKSSESIATLQRIDSVIIKNPDTNKSQDNETLNITSESSYSFHKENEPSYSSLEERNIETHDFSSETAIDFSLTRSEEETAVSYLNEMDRNANQNLPPLEEFDGEDLNEDEDISLTSGNIKLKNMSAKLNITPSAELIELSQGEHPKCESSKEYKNNKQTMNQEKAENPEKAEKVPVKSPKPSLANEEYNVLVMRSEVAATPKSLTVENLTSTKNSKNMEIPELDVQDKQSKCQELNVENSFTSSKDTSKFKKDINQAEPESTDASEKEIDLSSPLKPVIDNEDRYSRNKYANGLKHEMVSNKASFMTKTFIDNNDITENQTIEEVLKDLSNQDLDNLGIQSSSPYDTVKKEIFEFESNISLVCKNNKETVDTVLKESDIGITRTEGNFKINQPVTSEPKINDCKLDVRYDEESAVVFQQESENKINNAPITSSYSEEISCVKNKTDLPDLAIEITKCSSQTVSKSPEIQQDSKIKMLVSEFECLSDKKFMNNCVQTVLSLSTETFSKETNNESTQSLKMLDASDVDYLSNESDPNLNIQKNTHIFNNETESVQKSTIEFKEFAESKESSLTGMDQKEDHKTNLAIAESESLTISDKIKYESTESTTMLDASDVYCASNKSNSNSNVQKDSHIYKYEVESITKSILKFDECRKSKEPSPTAMDKKEDYETIIDIAEPECLKFSGETKNESTQSIKMQDASDVDYSSNKSDPNSNIQKDTHILQNETESVKKSTLEFKECAKSKESSLTSMDQKEDHKTNLDVAESESLTISEKTKNESTECTTMLDASDVDFASNKSDSNSNVQQDSHIYKYEVESVTKSILEFDECRKSKEPSPTAMDKKEDYGTIIDIAESKCLKFSGENESTQSVKMQDASDIDYSSNESDPNSNIQKDTHILKNETESVKKSTLEFKEYEKSKESSLTAMDQKEDHTTNLDIAESEILTISENTKNDSTEWVKILNASEFECASNKSNSNSNVQKHIVKYEGESVTKSTLKFDECRKSKEPSPTGMDQKDYETNIAIAESGCLTFSKETKNESTECAKMLDASDVDCSSNKSDPNRNDQNDTHIIKCDAETVTKSNLKCEECIQPKNSSPTAMDQNKDDKISIDKAGSECLTFLEQTKNESSETARMLDASDVDCSSNVSDLNSNDQKYSHILKDQKESVTNSTLEFEERRKSKESSPTAMYHCVNKNDEKRIDITTYMDIADSEFLSCKPYIDSVQLVPECCLTSNNKNPAIIDLEYDKELDNSIQNNFEEYCSPISHEIFPQNPISERAESEKNTEVKDNNLVDVAKLDINDPVIKDNANEFKDVTKTLNFSVKNMGHTYCQKELFSPWFQKLLMFTEGFYKSSKNKNSVEQEDNCGKNTVEQDARFENVELVFLENNDIEALKSNNEFRDIEKKASLLNDMHVTNEVLHSEHVKKQVIVQDNDSLTEKYQDIKNEDMQLSPAVVDSATIKPRKISKRSLSESALEAYKDGDNIDFVQPCKRKKGVKKNQSFLESHNMITEDICNIIQSNRRNSVSTFYNEDNVYIVIENDLIITEENDDSDTLCYTENNEEFLTSIDSTNFETNLNLENNSYTDEPNQVCEYTDSLQHFDEKSIEESWVDDVACMETVFSDDVAENIIIDVHTSSEKVNSLDLESDDGESTAFYDSEHIDKLKSIYGRTICNDNTQLIETLYRTPQMNVNKTLYHIESQDPEECLLKNVEDSINDSSINDSCIESIDILESGISSYKVFENEEKITENLSHQSEDCNQNTYPNFNHENEFKFDNSSTEEPENKFTIHSCESSNDYIVPSNIQKENSCYSCSSSPEVSSTTSEEKNSSILLKITNCNGSRVSQINEVNTDSHSKLSYKLTEKRQYQSYCSNFSSSRTLITKAAQKYIPPLKETIYDLKVKLPLPQHRLHTLKQLKIAKVQPKVDATANIGTVKRLHQDTSKKPKPKFEDVLKSIDEINFKRHKDNMKRGKISIPKVIIKKNENGAHYASSKSLSRKETYNPDLTGRKWQPWVFLEKNNFIDRMALQNKAKAVYCHRKKSYVLLEKFRKYKSVYNANFVISQPKSETKGNLKYTIRLKHN